MNRFKPNQTVRINDTQSEYHKSPAKVVAVGKLTIRIAPNRASRSTDVMKPRIKKDSWKPSGFTCRSKEAGGWKGDFTLIASGDTPEQAYFNWRFKRMTDPRFKGNSPR